MNLGVRVVKHRGGMVGQKDKSAPVKCGERRTRLGCPEAEHEAREFFSSRLDMVGQWRGCRFCHDHSVPQLDQPQRGVPLDLEGEGGAGLFSAIRIHEHRQESQRGRGYRRHQIVETRRAEARPAPRRW